MEHGVTELGEKLAHFSLKYTPASRDQRGWFDPYRRLGRPTLLQNMSALECVDVFAQRNKTWTLITFWSAGEWLLEEILRLSPDKHLLL